jgi:hypothetical protein
MKKLILFSILLPVSYISFSQGCIPIRSISGFGQYNFTDNAYSTSDWQLNFTNRYFKSFRDFREKTDLKTPSQNESVNEVYTMNISLSKLLTHGWSLVLDFPVSASSRTSSIEHGGFNTPRHTTQSFGLGDMRFTAYKWLLQPSLNQKWNLQLGLGLKFPTGDYKVEDYFYRDDTTKVLSAINPSIQLGDGGTGIITELNTFYVLNKTINFYGDFYYLMSPRNENGALYTFGKTPTSLQLKADAVNTSVPDVFSIRAGANINIKNVSFSIGIRDEGSPVHDLIGKSDGTRRAGYYFSVEPGLIYKMKKVTVFAYVPVVVSRRIKQNVPDKNITEITGVNTVGPGGSANYMILAGISFKL